MIWFKPLPPTKMDFSGWQPFIKQPWFRERYMTFVYIWMALVFVAPGLSGRSISGRAAVALQEQAGMGSAAAYALLVLLLPVIFIVHELLHIMVIYRAGDISLTSRGIFFWLNTDAVLGKGQFWLFMSLPLLTLSGVTGVSALALSGWAGTLMLYIAWVNLIISSSDLFNSVLIALKPGGSRFCRGYWRV